MACHMDVICPFLLSPFFFLRFLLILLFFPFFYSGKEKKKEKKEKKEEEKIRKEEKDKWVSFVSQNDATSCPCGMPHQCHVRSYRG
jgi:flagellar biosynthesis component FlhA